MNLPEIQKILDTFVPMQLSELESSTFMERIDTKYVFSVNRIPELLKVIDGQYKALEIKNERIFTYYNTYFDTTDREFLYEHLRGKSGRSKVRARHYTSTGVTFLEIKRKTQKKRTIKWRIENQMADNAYDSAARKFIASYLNFGPEKLSPSLKNNFKRITLASINGHEHITIDMDISFLSPDGKKKAAIPSIAIAELKTIDLPIKSPVFRMIKQLSIFPMGFSKYCTGNAILFDLPKLNMIKPKLLLINKLENEYNRFGNA
jgi:VTC domain